jgi:dTDP-4-dehydrorhamnose 3,5-epimerase-like enzyme
MNNNRIKKIRNNKCRIVELPSIQDSRGTLTSIESEIDILFRIERVFYMHHILMDRGGHAHRETDQIIIAVSGKFKVEILEGNDSKSYFLEDPKIGLYIPRMVFIEFYEFSADSVCLVLASDHYDISRSIRSKDEYLKEVKYHQSNFVESSG